MRRAMDFETVLHFRRIMTCPHLARTDALTGAPRSPERGFRGIKALTAEAYRAESVTRMVRVQALALSHSSASRSLGLASGALGYWRRVTASREV